MTVTFSRPPNFMPGRLLPESSPKTTPKTPLSRGPERGRLSPIGDISPGIMREASDPGSGHLGLSDLGYAGFCISIHNASHLWITPLET
jgi:hypothetical protein